MNKIAKNTVAGLYHTDQPLIEAVRQHIFKDLTFNDYINFYDTNIVLEVDINLEPEQDVFDCSRIELTITDDEGENERIINVDELHLEILAHLTTLRIAYYEQLNDHNIYEV